MDPRIFCNCTKWQGRGNLLVPNFTGVQAHFALGEFDYPVLEASLAAAIEELDNEVQLVPLSIAGRSGTHVILNVLRSLECIDEEASEFDRFTVTGSRPDLAGQYKVFYRLRLQFMFESLELRREADIGKDLKPLRSNSTEGIKETHALGFHQQGDDESCGSADADFTMDKQLGLWITGRCSCCEVEELRNRPSDILMHSIVDTEKQMMKVLL